ncbi:hypothetical protein RJT34_13558 [Clitoria ternatea]|uniref:Uncharacterized protein n=1 Tax=Clitoria ternatea TaxID=43366 RepID=A0AAN9JNT0_CLITE
MRFNHLHVLLAVSLLSIHVGTSLDTITPSQFLKDPQTLSSNDVFTWRGNQPYWRSGPWNGQIFLGIPDMFSFYLDGFHLSGVDDGNPNNTYYLSYTFANHSTLIMYVLGSKGNVYELNWDYASKQWFYTWFIPNSDCDVYGFCGVFGSCDSRTSPICSCLNGFEPRNAEEWSKQNWTSGCVRKEPLQCERVTNKSEAGSLDGFLKLPNTKVPDFAQWSSSPYDDCRTQCMQNCSCLAYAYDAGIGCMTWSGGLIDIQRFSIVATDLYIRVPNSLLDDKKNNAVIIAVTVTIGTILVITCGYLFWKRTARREEKTNQNIQNRSQENDMSSVHLPELSQFEFGKLATATHNFHLTNKLGQGGFGLVYKVFFITLNFNIRKIMSYIALEIFFQGVLEDGQEIAVKRLSRTSGQGLEEFMNEVLVISKLQHRNLVKLLGCCIEGDEKILIYEYMPNRSLDAYMFGAFEQEDAANTRRVVGTYGYMSPEYAIEGLFSEKSDVFSFGVLLLEIVSRRKNTSFYENAEALSLLGYAWKLWNDGNITSLIDPEISNPSFHSDIFRCIHIGLLCVQELARDRPTMTTVISMLTNETVNLPSPRQPAFIHRQTILDVNCSYKSDESRSINYMSITNIQGR